MVRVLSFFFVFGGGLFDLGLWGGEDLLVFVDERFTVWMVIFRCCDGVGRFAGDRLAISVIHYTESCVGVSQSLS